MNLTIAVLCCLLAQKEPKSGSFEGVTFPKSLPLLPVMVISIKRDLATDVAAARNGCVKTELQSVAFRNRLQVFQAVLQSDITDSGNSIVQQLRDASLPPVEAERLQLLINNCVSVSLNVVNSLTSELRNTETDLTKIIGYLDSDLGQLGQADRDLRTHLVRINSTWTEGDANIATNFVVAEYSVFEAADTVDFETNIAVRTMWQHVVDKMDQERTAIGQEKILLDGQGDLAVTALDIVVDQLP